MMIYSASRCPCGHPSCRDWHVDGVAAVQGVGFTEVQARATAALLDAMEDNSFDQLIAQCYQRVDDRVNPEMHRVYYECRLCGGTNPPGGFRSTDVVHDYGCALPHLRIIARTQA